MIHANIAMSYYLFELYASVDSFFLSPFTANPNLSPCENARWDFDSFVSMSLLRSKYISCALEIRIFKFMVYIGLNDYIKLCQRWEKIVVTLPTMTINLVNIGSRV